VLPHPRIGTQLVQPRYVRLGDSSQLETCRVHQSVIAHRVVSTERSQARSGRHMVRAVELGRRNSADLLRRPSVSQTSQVSAILPPLMRWMEMASTGPTSRLLAGMPLTSPTCLPEPSS